GKVLALGHAGHPNWRVTLWDLKEGKAVRTIDGNENRFVPALAFSPDGETLVASSFFNALTNAQLKLWDTTTGRERAQLGGHTRVALALACSPDGQVLASGSLDGTVRLWDAATGQERTVLQGQGRGGVSAVVFSSDSRTLVSAHRTGTIHIWDQSPNP